MRIWRGLAGKSRSSNGGPDGAVAFGNTVSVMARFRPTSDDESSRNRHPRGAAGQEDRRCGRTDRWTGDVHSWRAVDLAAGDAAGDPSVTATVEGSHPVTVIHAPLVASLSRGVPSPHASRSQPSSRCPVARCLARYPSRRRGLSNHGGRSLRLGPRETVSPSESAGPCAVQAPVVNGAATSMGSSSSGTRSMVFSSSAQRHGSAAIDHRARHDGWTVYRVVRPRDGGGE